MFQLQSLIMAKEASLCFLFLSLLIISCSGDTSTSTSSGTSSFLKQSKVPSSQFSERVTKYLETRAERMAALYAEMHTKEDFALKDLKREGEKAKFFRRRILDESNNPTNTVFPANPTTPVITPPADTPTIIAVPSTNPVTISPTNPAAVPATVTPSTTFPSPPTNPVAAPATVTPSTPLPSPPTNPAFSPVPVTNPATSTPPTATTPPVTPSFPPPSGSVPVPVINPQPPPANTNNPPSTQGQSWCVAKSGAPQASIQAALDYACGKGADCSPIQQGGSCYSPVTLQNHASFAFNSYYQKNPAPTSCDFGGTATLVNTNPSSGSCIFPSSSAAAATTPMTPSLTPPTLSSPTPPTAPLTPKTLTPPSSFPTAPPTTPTGSSTYGYGTPPSVLNSSNPASGSMPDFGTDSPPVVNSTTSASHPIGLKPFTGYMVLMISFVTARLSMHP